MAEEDAKALNFVHETVLKKRKNNEDWAIKRRGQLAAKKQRNQESLKLAIKRPEQFVKEYRDKELDIVRMKHRLKKRKAKPEKFDSKLLFVIRIHGSQGMHPETRRVLNRLRLRHIFEGVFVKVNQVTSKLLMAAEPFITYGYPNLMSVKDLVYKKGCGRIGRQRFPLTDNNLIEQSLGQHNIICLEDIVHEIATVGPRFKDVTNFLWPLKLKKPENMPLRKKSYKDGGDTGNRGSDINEFISKLN
ncbi:large subunit ribosomal protein L7e protein [Dioscorea alata]|uniref:Large subunit ribosomal protein L7e protein n=1 Tax=Dioscorea alata TaxID=55571 RepID=A0ACB7WAN6_DIOAL|nr:large subunit ribosomal protein L7e protein [Dioscorea alata]